MQNSADPKGYYRLLGIDPTADLDDVKRAYRARVKKLHPDHNQGQSARTAFLAVQHAYRILTDPQKREAYDRAIADHDLLAEDRLHAEDTGRSAVDRFLQVRTQMPGATPPVLLRRYKLLLLMLAIILAGTGAWVYWLNQQVADISAPAETSLNAPKSDQSASTPIFSEAPDEALAHIAIERAAVYLHPRHVSPVVDRMQRFDTVRILGQLDSGFLDVVTPRDIRGFIHQAQLDNGDGWEARRQSCTSSGAAPDLPVLFRRGNGLANLDIVNGTAAELLVKLKDSRQSTHLTAYVKPGKAVTIEQVPWGDYRIYIATGQELSRPCQLFRRNMQSLQLATALAIDIQDRTVPSLVVTPVTLAAAAPVNRSIFLLD